MNLSPSPEALDQRTVVIAGVAIAAAAAVIVSMAYLSECVAAGNESWRTILWTTCALVVVLIVATAVTATTLSKRGRVAALQTQELERRVEERTAALRETEGRLQAILDNAEAVISVKDRSGRYLLVNRRFERLFGASAANVRGRTDHDIFPTHVADAFAANDRAVLASGAMQFEEVAPQSDGPHTYLSTKFPLLDPAGVAVAVCGMSTDITDRKFAETELKRAKDAAELATRAKSEFLANMSHEIRTPLNAVIGMTALILDTSLDAEQREYAETIRRSGEALLSVISDILDFSRIESGKLRLEEAEFSLAAIVEESLDIVAPHAAEKGLDLGYHIDADVPGEFFGDAARVRQVLLNLLSNAVKFTEKGEVSVWIGSAPKDAGRHELRFSVRDTGIGIAPDRRDRLFHSFSQLDPSTTRRFGGTGLGLVISKALCEMMGGRIWAESEPGRGSDFQFTITARAAPARPPESAEVLVGRMLRRRLLVVHSGDASRRILELRATSWGMTPRGAGTGAQALAWMREGETFDVAVIDEKLADMDGETLVRQIRELGARGAIPIVMLTSLGRHGTDAAGFAGVVTKPVKPTHLLEVLAGALNPGRVRASPPAAPSALRTPVAEAPPRDLRILVAEDNVVNQRVVVRMIEKLGCRADVAGTGLEALSAIERDDYDVVLMDVQMPDMDGLAATRELIRRIPAEKRPVILAMTANARREDEEACIAAGMDGFIAKPVRPEVLRDALAGVGGARPPAPAPLDAVAFDRLRVLEHNAPGVLKEIVDLYLADTPRRIASLHAAVQTSDTEALRALAHGLKGSSGYIGAREIETLCADVERLLRSGRKEEAFTRVGSLDAALERVRTALAAAA